MIKSLKSLKDKINERFEAKADEMIRKATSKKMASKKVATKKSKDKNYDKKTRKNK